MPKIVDHHKRRELIAKSTWDIISQKGIEQATTRRIAEETGISQSALRYYFPTRKELLTFAMDLLKDKVESRLKIIWEKDIPVLEKVVQLLMEITPYSEISRKEMEVWFAFITHCRKEEGFDLSYDDVIKVIELALTMLEENDLLRQEVSRDMELEKLYSVIDGLAIHALFHPERYSPSYIRSIIENHLMSMVDIDEQ
ncbi:MULTISPECIES: TetR/AcrR family transcriptional regulator [Gracilibacillus]|uniref:TetR/AcrR family transcriptional regulator n=1 Tax=Gracilibacillus TaxID=74385 RepID=UPI0008244411|nr:MULTISPECIES: TetR/AcrR family transcriptional regulator [Gracilibacillus]